MATDDIPAIRKYFTVEDAPRKPGVYLITCEKCGDQWHLPKKMPPALGNILHLLNHARGHKDIAKAAGRK